jgi:hypothetical protein
MPTAAGADWTHFREWTPRRVRAAVLLACALLLALRVVRAFTLAVNSDEAQHLHVVWAWTQGLVVYRDVFDNHTPLFHLLCAPLLMLLGERADVVLWARLAVIPLYFGTLYATWHIGRSLWSSRTGLYAALLAGAIPVFFDTSTQFRTDDLWMLLWTATVAAAVARPFTAARAFLVGALAGATFCVSAKTTLLLATALLAAATLAILERPRAAARPALLAAWATCGVAGLLLLPSAFAVYFLARDAGQQALYSVFQHNLVAGLGHGNHVAWHLWLFPAGYALAAAAAAALRSRVQASRWRRGGWVLLSATAYLLALFAYWPLVTHQDLLPALPLLALLPAAWLTAPATPRRDARWRPFLAAALLAFAFGALVIEVLGAPDRYAPSRDELARILSLSRPGEYVMDAKGESVFRPRPFFWVLEGVTEQRLRDGSLRDDLPARLEATSTMLLVDDRLPDADRAFVETNYLPSGGRLRVAGRRLGVLAAGQGVDFPLAIAGDYRFVDRHGGVSGWLDGERVDGPVRLTAGMHRFVPSAAGEVVLVWARALERGLSPQSLLAPESPPFPR